MTTKIKKFPKLIYASWNFRGEKVVAVWNKLGFHIGDNLIPNDSEGKAPCWVIAQENFRWHNTNPNL